jgi:hypothetical protein
MQGINRTKEWTNKGLLLFVWPCIIDIDSKEDKQLDATITVYW